MNAATMRRQVIALRNAATTVVLLADAMLSGIAEARELTPENPTESPTECSHPASRRQPTPVMGKPNAGICGACGTELED